MRELSRTVSKDSVAICLCVFTIVAMTLVVEKVCRIFRHQIYLCVGHRRQMRDSHLAP